MDIAVNVILKQLSILRKFEEAFGTAPIAIRTDAINKKEKESEQYYDNFDELDGKFI